MTTSVGGLKGRKIHAYSILIGLIILMFGSLVVTMKILSILFLIFGSNGQMPERPIFYIKLIYLLLPIMFAIFGGFITSYISKDRIFLNTAIMFMIYFVVWSSCEMIISDASIYHITWHLIEIFPSTMVGAFLYKVATFKSNQRLQETS